MNRNIDLYGTAQTPMPRENHAFGPWSFSLENGVLRHIKLNGVEAIRAIAFLVRDRDWGTLAPVLSNQKVDAAPTALTLSYDADYASADAKLGMRIVIKVTPDGLSMSADGQADGDFETNRAGFTVLHPISGVAGQPVHVTHSDGTQADSAFPDLIEPWQPFMDISALTHQVGDAALTCQFHGDTFEMEDQRQWGDASFKTYNRPLAKPWPYVLQNAEQLNQSVDLSWAPRQPASLTADQPTPENVTFPEMALVLTPDDAMRLAKRPNDITVVNPQRLLCHLDATLGGTADQFKAFAAAQTACPDQAYDLELICSPDSGAVGQLATLAEDMKASGFVPNSILVCPSVDRQSTPPGSEWPECLPLEDIHAAAARAFPNMQLGGGMASFFPELNRKRPPVDMLAFVSHGLCPIVHAADDLSVMETLETIPHITRSARAIIGDKDYRIGPATIAMRQNPYGTRVIPNPNNERVCMTDDDPRHRGKFGAAYVIGLATALAPAGLTVWTPAALYGPRGVVSDHGQWSISLALKSLATLAGQPVRTAEISGGIARLCVGNVEQMANLKDQPDGAFDAYGWSVRLLAI